LSFFGPIFSLSQQNGGINTHCIQAHASPTGPPPPDRGLRLIRHPQHARRDRGNGSGRDPRCGRKGRGGVSQTRLRKADFGCGKGNGLHHDAEEPKQQPLNKFLT
jgi:hypothetical protein